MVLGKLFSGLRRTRDRLASGLSRLFTLGRKLDRDFLDELEEVLYTADLGTTGSKVVEELEEAWRRKEVREVDEVRGWLHRALRARLEGCEGTLARAAQGPTVVLVVGVNGSGKTTSIAKLAHRAKSRGEEVLLAAGDTFRAAAVEQLTRWADRMGVDIVVGESGADPASVAYDAVGTARSRGADTVIVDTAGRLHTQKNLMEELRKVVRVIRKQLPDAPHETLLVLDATTGQNALRQAAEFHAAAEITGVVLAEMDGTAKGGAVFGIRDQLDLPIKFVGVGEGLEDLEPFDADAFVEAVLAFDTGEAEER